jgi:hypothetical protein
MDAVCHLLTATTKTLPADERIGMSGRVFRLCGMPAHRLWLHCGPQEQALRPIGPRPGAYDDTPAFVRAPPPGASPRNPGNAGQHPFWRGCRKASPALSAAEPASSVPVSLLCQLRQPCTFAAVSPQPLRLHGGDAARRRADDDGARRALAKQLQQIPATG